MKSIKLTKRASKKNNAKNSLASALRTAKRGSAYAFVASLGIWLPRAEAATLINLDAATHPLGPLSTWTNTGTVIGDFTVPGGTTATPTNMVVDGVNGISFIAVAGAGGGVQGSHYVGPIAPTSVCTNNPRTVEAWIYNDSSQGEEVVFAWGRRGADGLNNSFGHGASAAFGAVAMWGDPDIGWGDATNRVLGRWTYIVQSFDGVTNSVYVDGRLANTEGPPATALINTAEVDLNSLPIPFRVARQIEDSGAVSDAGDGDLIIGRIRVHDVALSASAISNQFVVEMPDFNLNDSDGDGMPDWYEARHGLDEGNPADAALDNDTDGLTNLQEFNAGTDPNDSDSDDDGALDGAEVNRIDPQTLLAAPTNPFDADSDDDGLLDGVETDTGTFVNATDTGTDPLKGDTDGDIASDGMEVGAGTNPNNPLSTPSLARAIDLDATGLPGGPITNWPNTGTIPGNFIVLTNWTAPNVTTNDGVKAVRLLATGGATGTHFVGPASTADLTGANPRTTEAWVRNLSPQDEEPIIAWGKRGGTAPDGANWSFNEGQNDAYGAVAMWGGPDIGWNNQEVYGRWTHLAATYDGTTTRCYVDGVLVNTETIAISTVHLDTGSNPLPFRVGRQSTEAGGIDSTGAGELEIAKIRVYTNALDGATIRARFESEQAFFGLVDPDGDGLPTWYEIRWNLDPNDNAGVNGAGGNPDNDGLTNIEEFELGTAASVADTDGDGLNDGAEVNRLDIPSGLPAATNPLVADTDGDGLRDGVETDTGTFVNVNSTGSDPLVVDSDGDTFSDGTEVSQGSNPVDPLIVPSPNPRIELIATNLPLGTISMWTNNGTFSTGIPFVSTNAVTPSVAVRHGVRGVRFPGPANTGPFFTGPTNTADANLTGNPVYSIEAWIFNEGPAVPEETIFSWGGRNVTVPTGPNGRNSSFNHGTSGQFGCMGHWGGGPDLGYGNAANVIQGRWTYVAYTYDALANPPVQRAFVNGAQVNQENVGGGFTIAAVGNGGQPLPFRIGAQNENNGNPTGDLRANGLSIGELRVYTRALSTNEIAANFAAGAITYGTGDQDNDLMPDWFERTYPFLNELDPNDANLDSDGDGYSNVNEYLNSIGGIQNSTDPSNPDTDGDGVPDGTEIGNVTNPNNRDTDRDGVEDGREMALGISPNQPDTDGDGATDMIEVLYGSDPLDFNALPDTSVARPVINLDANSLPAGSLPLWTNHTVLGWNFEASTNSLSVTNLVASKGVVFTGANGGYYTGPGMPVHMGVDSARTVEAWLFNPVRGDQETVFAWGRRGADNRNSAFSHGLNGAFGAIQFWGAGDLPWGTNGASIQANVTGNAWTYVAYSWNPTNRMKSVYRDGVLVHSATNIAAQNTFIDEPLDPLNALGTPIGRTLKFRVAAQNGTDGSVDTVAAPTTMTISKIRAWDVTLDAAQIAANYNAEVVLFPNRPVITGVQVNPANGFIKFDWNLSPGRTYAVETNADLSNPSGWAPIATGLTSGVYSNTAAGAQNNYRVRIEPLP